MASPNLVSPTTVLGKTESYSCTASLGAALSNSAASGKVLKVNTIRATNISSSAAAVDVTLYRSGTHRYQLKNGSVPFGGALVLLDKNEYLYVQEGDSIYAKAGSASSVELTISYEEIS